MAGKRVNGAESHDGGIEDDAIPVTITANGGVEPLDDYSGIVTVEPSSLGGENAENDGGPRKRGRPRGAKTASAKQTTKEVSSDLEGILLSLHFMGAALLKAPELCLSDEEAAKLSKAIARVNAEYGNVILPPKTAAWINLAICAGGVYGPRMVAIKNNRKNAQKEKPSTTVH
jgi:hypothetical protein